MQSQPFVVYLRVSTQRQGADGLGMDAQRSACMRYVEQHAGTVLSTHSDVSSGTNNARKGLAAAIALCEAEGACLLVSDLDRLGRDVAKLVGLIQHDWLRVANRPNASKTELQMLAVFAQHEVDRIRERTRAALEQAKKRGVLLGSARPGHWDGKEHLRRAGGEKGRLQAAAVLDGARGKRYERVLPELMRVRSSGLSLAGVAAEMTRLGIPAPGGGKWTRRMVQTCMEASK